MSRELNALAHSLRPLIHPIEFTGKVLGCEIAIDKTVSLVGSLVEILTSNPELQTIAGITKQIAHTSRAGCVLLGIQSTPPETQKPKDDPEGIQKVIVLVRTSLIVVAEKVAAFTQILLFVDSCGGSLQVHVIAEKVATFAAPYLGEHSAYLSGLTTKKINDFSAMVLLLDLSLSSLSTWRKNTGKPFNFVEAIPPALKLILIGSAYLFPLSPNARAFLTLAAAYYDVIVAYEEATQKASMLKMGQRRQKRETAPPADLQRKLEEEKRKVDSLQGALEAANKKAKDFEEAAQRLEDQLANREVIDPNDLSHDNPLSAQLVLAEQELDTLRERVKSIPKIGKKLEKRDKEIKLKETEISKLQSDMKQLEEELGKAKEGAGRASDLEGFLDSKTEAYEELNETVTKLRNEIDEVKKKAEAAKEDVQKAEAKITDKQSTLLRYEQRITELNATITTLRREKEQAEANSKKAERNMQDANTNVGQHLASISVKEEKILELECTIELLREEKKEIEKAKNLAEEEADIAIKTADMRQGAIGELESEVGSLKRQLAKLEKEIREANMNLEMATRERKEASEFADKTEERLVAKKKEADAEIAALSEKMKKQGSDAFQRDMISQEKIVALQSKVDALEAAAKAASAAPYTEEQLQADIETVEKGTQVNEKGEYFGREGVEEAKNRLVGSPQAKDRLSTQQNRMLKSMSYMKGPAISSGTTPFRISGSSLVGVMDALKQPMNTGTKI